MRNAADGTWTGGPIVHPLFIVVGRVRQSRTVTPGGLTAARDARAADPDVTSLRPISSDKDETDGPAGRKRGGASAGRVGEELRQGCHRLALVCRCLVGSFVALAEGVQLLADSLRVPSDNRSTSRRHA